MIHLFTGDDAKNKRIVYEKFVKSIPKVQRLFLLIEIILMKLK